MKVAGAAVLLTGGAGGIGAAMARSFAAAGARSVTVTDLDGDGAARVAAELGGTGRAIPLDVTDRSAVEEALAATEAAVGPLDLVCANAGIATGAGVEADEEVWERTWSVNVGGIVHVAAAYVHRVRRRGDGHLLITASAAGLLTNLGDAPYTATKHAAVGLAEWLAISHGEEGLRVSCLCPQGVRTPMVTAGLDDDQLAAEVVAAQGLIEPEECAAAVLDGLAADRFLILPHPEVATYVRHKADDPERWIRAMRRLQASLRPGG